MFFPAGLTLTCVDYNLYAGVVHEGDESWAGHYVSYVRNNNKWYKCDDHIISDTTLEQVLNTPAYILLYQKIAITYRFSFSG